MNGFIHGQDGVTVTGTRNPDGQHPGWYQVLIAKNGTNEIRVQIFDPDCWNVGNALDAGPGKVDEIRSAPPSPHPQPSNRYTTTRYQLYAPDNTPGNYDDDVLIAQATWTPDMKSCGCIDRFRFLLKITSIVLNRFLQ